ncbi:MAG: ParB/RepB/Spo0J family partition protein [Flavobacteriales bacterium]|nr:ParB/RepB/Spo0J family partition protein [Flavobacteriales bacterium]MCB9191309.1 ParB/RepB/Spo0J family partition protein [Flavobacteriales bacterium]MCB9204315.1 ParB/RepB/Spo0J family partition protein [Flavobacteriales bacterium]
MAKKSALGRGLGALLDNSGSDAISRNVVETDGATGSISEISIEQIEANPFQPRTRFDQEKLDELAASIGQLGIIQPLTVRKVRPNKYQLISGERRFRASQLAGLVKVPAYIRVANDQDMLEMALVENIQRDDLDAIEVAISYQRLIDECNLTQEALGDRVGKNRSTITNYLRLLKLPPQIQKAIMDKVLTMGHARAIINISDEEQQLQLFKQIIKDGMSVRATEAASKSAKGSKSAKKELPVEYQRIEQNIKDQLNANVGLKVNAKGKGSISISFDNEKELKRVLSILDLWP